MTEGPTDVRLSNILELGFENHGRCSKVSESTTERLPKAEIRSYSEETSSEADHPLSQTGKPSSIRVFARGEEKRSANLLETGSSTLGVAAASATTNQVILACPGIYSARCMCQAFGRRDASQKRRRRRYAEANTAKGPVPGIIFGRERKDPLRLSSLLLLIRRNPKRRDLSATEGTRTTIRRRGTKSHRAPAEAKCWIFLIASDREPAVVAFEGSSMKDYSSAMDNFDRGNRGALSLSTMPDGSTERGLRRMSTL